MLVTIDGWLRNSVHAFPRNPQPSAMAAIVENAENRQIGSDLAYTQSSDSDSLLSSENVLDPSNLSTKGVDYGHVQKVNGLSHVSEDPPLLPKTGANNTHGTGAVKADTQPTPVSCNVSEKDVSETSRTREVVSTEMDPWSMFSQSIQNKSPSLVAGSSPCEKDEKKVELKVPLDSNSNCPLSFKKSENSCDEDESKKSSVSSWHSVGIEPKTLESKTNEQSSSLFEDANNKEKPLISENQTTNKTSTLEGKYSESDFNDHRLCKTAEKPTINGNGDSINLKETNTILSKSATDHNAIHKTDSEIGMVVDEKLSEETNSTTDHNASFKKALTNIASIADEKLLEKHNLKSVTDLSDLDKVVDDELLEKCNLKSTTDHNTALIKELNDRVIDLDEPKTITSKSTTDHTDTLEKDLPRVPNVVDQKFLGENNSKSVTLEKDLTDVDKVADEKLRETNNSKSATDPRDLLKIDLSDVTSVVDEKFLLGEDFESDSNEKDALKKDLNDIVTLADWNSLDKNNPKSTADHNEAPKKDSNTATVDKKLSEEKISKLETDHDFTLKKEVTDKPTVADETKTKSATDPTDTFKKDLTHGTTIADKKLLEETLIKSATSHTDSLKMDFTRVAPVRDEKLLKEEKNESKFSTNSSDIFEKGPADQTTVADKKLLEKNNLKSETDQIAPLQKDSNLASVVDEKLLEDTDSKSTIDFKNDLKSITSVAEVKLAENSKSAADQNTSFKNEFTDNKATVAGEILSNENNSNNYPESSSDSKTFQECLSETKTEKSSSPVSNIPELLAYCSPCRVVVQDFFKELNIDLLELSRNFPVHHRKRLKTSNPVQGSSLGEEQVKNNSFDVLGRTKQSKCYTESSKKRKKHPTTTFEQKGDSSDSLDDEDEEDNLPLLSVRNNLTQGGNIAAGLGKFNDNKTTAAEMEKYKMVHTKGANSGAAANEEKSVTDSTISDVPLVTPPTKAEPADPTQRMPATDVPATVDINDSNDLGLKIVSISSQGSVFFPAFTSDDNSENIVFSPSDTSSKLNGQIDTTTCENSTAKLSRPTCKFHGPDSSPAQNLYKCKKCGLEAKSLSDIQAHMAGSHSEFCMYRCPYCMPPLRVKRVSIYNNRPIEFEVLRESSHKLLASASSTNSTSSSAMSVKRKMPRHIQIQRDKRRKLNYYYHNQREIKKYKNRKISCQYCHKMINQSNISRHQNGKKCSNPMKKKMLQHSLIPKKYQKVKCDSCQKHISRTNMSKHSRICPRENED